MSRKKRKRISKKRKVAERILAIIPFLVAISLVVLSVLSQKVEIIYFTNPKCAQVDKTDILMREIKSTFGNRVEINEIIIKIFEGDPEDPPYVEELREIYKVYGAPTIVVADEIFDKLYTWDNLIIEICDNFTIKPVACRGVFG